jgi:AMP phosphorylase
MNFKYRKMGIAAGEIRIVVMDDDDAFELGVKPGDRVRVSHLKEDGTILEPGIIAIVDIATGENIIERGRVGFYDELYAKLNLTDDIKEVTIDLSSKPLSFEAIKAKVKGKELTTAEIQAIINDCARGNLLDIEKAAFIVGLEVRDATEREIVDLTNAMTNSGEVLDFGEEVYDKHSTGGVPGNKVTLIIVPICAAAGLFIPKTSTRAITSPSGTADSMEVLAPVMFTKQKLIEILNDEKAGILWGGALDSAPADNALINIEKPLSMDPFCLMIASILCKKKAMGVRHLVLDIPCGKGTKFHTITEGRKFAFRFKDIAKKVGIEAICLLTAAEQPVGHAVGPALEAQEAIRLLRDISAGPSSLLNKSCELAGILLEMAGKAPEGEGKQLAIDILKSGQAYESMKRIIKVQGGNPEILPEDIKIGQYVAEMRSLNHGVVTKVNNKSVNKIAKLAGCPSIKQAGIEILRKIGQKVKKGEIIFKIYATSENRLKEAVEYYNKHPPQILGGMTLEKV